MGDPVQLPATVISGRADKHGYCTSLFKRLQTSGFPVQVTAAACCFLYTRHRDGDGSVALTALLMAMAAQPLRI